MIQSPGDRKAKLRCLYICKSIAQVGCRLIQILMESAYTQPPVDQLEDGPPDIRPAFVHTLETVETQRGRRRYGVIECDPLVRKGLEKTRCLFVFGFLYHAYTWSKTTARGSSKISKKSIRTSFPGT